MESEGNDRKDMELPGEQLNLLKDTVLYGRSSNCFLYLGMNILRYECERQCYHII